MCEELDLLEMMIAHNKLQNESIEKLDERIKILEGHVEFILTSEKGIYKS